MSDTGSMAETKARLAAVHASADDMGWLASLGWNDAAVPPIKDPGQLAAYERREKILNAAIAHLANIERGATLESHMAAAIGARIADWKDKRDNADED